MPRPALFSAGFTGPLHPAQGRLGGLVYTSSVLVAARGPGTPRRGRAAFWADPQRQRESDVVKRSCPIPASFSPPDVLSCTPCSWTPSTATARSRRRTTALTAG